MMVRRHDHFFVIADVAMHAEVLVYRCRNHHMLLGSRKLSLQVIGELKWLEASALRQAVPIVEILGDHPGGSLAASHSIVDCPLPGF
jgi:hypothetical protein